MTKKENKKLGKWIFQIANKNTDALLDIYFNIKGIVYSVGNTYYPNKEDLEDSVQELLVLIIEKAEKYSRNENACAWIMRIYRNTFINHYDHEKVKEKYLDKISQDLLTRALTSENYFEKYLIYQFILDKLDEYEKELMYYKFLYELSIGEIAKIFNKPKSTIQYQIAKLQEKIRNLK